ncbi:methyltransferase domain-containing protein [Asticcacaulis sp. DW145]|uniref:class I SAM-dependent methyltransferase n=1 Tax=Asticcacaulis sp. DW145 TaxID=3095608 RepID=UPI0030933CC2|nr:methyltransferase domain-containing protein [Asticcacaulis sp. DW145]
MDSVTDHRVLREKEFHEKRFSEFDHRESQKKYYWAVWDGAEKYLQTVRQLAAGMSVLEYGCGDTDVWKQVGPNAKTYVGIDISGAAVSRLEGECDLINTSFHVMDAHKMTFEDESFDLIFGSGIIHHLETEKAAREIARVLRPGGKAIFWEPLGGNPLINAYRFFTPDARTEDEHPLMARDYSVLRKEIGDMSLSFFGLFTLLSVPLPDSVIRTSAFHAFRKIDELLSSIPGVRYLSWYCLSTFTKQKI